MAPNSSAATPEADEEPTSSADPVAPSDIAGALEEGVHKCSVRYALSGHSRLNAAIKNLRLAFGYGFPEAVGYVNLRNRKHRCSSEHVHFLQTLESWAIMKNVDAVIWIDYESLASRLKLVCEADSVELQQQLVRDAFEGARTWRRPLIPEHVQRRLQRQTKISDMTSWTAPPRIPPLPSTRREPDIGRPKLCGVTSTEASPSSRGSACLPEKARKVRGSRATWAGGLDSRASLASESILRRSWQERRRDDKVKKPLFRSSSTMSLVQRQARVSSLASPSRHVSRRSSVLARLFRDAQRRRIALQKVLKERRTSDSTIDSSNCEYGERLPECTETASPRRSTALSQVSLATELPKTSRASLSNAWPVSHRHSQQAVSFHLPRNKSLAEDGTAQKITVCRGPASLEKQDTLPSLGDTSPQDQSLALPRSMSRRGREAYRMVLGKQRASAALASRTATASAPAPRRRKTRRAARLSYGDIRRRTTEHLRTFTEHEMDEACAKYLEQVQPEVVGGRFKSAYNTS